MGKSIITGYFIGNIPYYYPNNIPNINHYYWLMIIIPIIKWLFSGPNPDFNYGTSAECGLPLHPGRGARRAKERNWGPTHVFFATKNWIYLAKLGILYDFIWYFIWFHWILCRWSLENVEFYRFHQTNWVQHQADGKFRKEMIHGRIW